MPAGAIRVGVVGCGVVAAAYYLPYLRRQPDVALVAVCDTNPTRAAACARLFGARTYYTDYQAMLDGADLDAVFILTGPTSHARFTLAAVSAGKHVLLQKPMALTMDDAHAIVAAVRRTGVRVLVEPSAASPLEAPLYPRLRDLVRQGAIGRPLWFTWMPAIATSYHPSLGGNPYGAAAFYARDSGGMLLDFPYAPTQIATILGSCRRVTGLGAISVPNRYIVPDAEYDRFLSGATDPDHANYWKVVVNLPRTQPVRMEAEDTVFSLYEMDCGAIGVFHIARALHPMPPGVAAGGFHVFGDRGNLVIGGTGHGASLLTTRADLALTADVDGWCHLDDGRIHGPSQWPIPAPGSFNYYHESTRHLLDCILEDRDPLLNVEWGRHITEMLLGALESSRTGQRYEMTTTLDGLRP
jgi:predicted dehydrogenase